MQKFFLHANRKQFHELPSLQLSFFPLSLSLSHSLCLSLPLLQMQAYRDNFKQTPCPSAVDLPGPPGGGGGGGSGAGGITSQRLPFSRNRGGRGEPSNHAHNGTGGAITPRMMSPGPAPPPGPSTGDCSTNTLLRQNQELRQRLADESHSYRRRLDTYKQAQHNQANLVSRLQSKIQQYRQRCSDLEERMHDTIKPTTTTTSTVPCAPKLTTGPTASQVLVSIPDAFTGYLRRSQL